MISAIPHDLFSFMSEISHEVAAEYERIRRRTREDPGTAGDEGEENWADVLRNWLPSYYHVVTKGRLIGHDGQTSPQVDVLVLKPSYPHKFRSKKLYLAAGVAAAFECKITLQAAYFSKLFDNCIAIKSLFPARHGSPYRELRSPILYGLLAHSHCWKAQGSEPLSKIVALLHHTDTSKVQHPRLGLDLVCVADLGTWSVFTMPYHGPIHTATWRNLEDYPDGYAMTSYVGHNEESPNQLPQFTPIGTLISYMVQKLGCEDPACRDIADYYRLANLSGTGAGVQRLWQPSIYSEEVRMKVMRGML